MYTVIVSETKDHRIAKYQEFQFENDANVHVKRYGGFVYHGIISNIEYITVNMNTETLTVDTKKRDSDKIINDWQLKIKQSDLSMTRTQEDLIDHMINIHGQTVDAETKIKWDEKKEIRSSQPK